MGSYSWRLRDTETSVLTEDHPESDKKEERVEVGSSDWTECLESLSELSLESCIQENQSCKVSILVVSPLSVAVAQPNAIGVMHCAAVWHGLVRPHALMPKL